MPLTPDAERWAEALQIERMFGERAPTFVAVRLGALAKAGDAAGVERFREIARRLDRLRRGDAPVSGDDPARG